MRRWAGIFFRATKFFFYELAKLPYLHFLDLSTAIQYIYIYHYCVIGMSSYRNKVDNVIGSTQYCPHCYKIICDGGRTYIPNGKLIMEFRDKSR